jgi:hypothetical protein
MKKVIFLCVILIISAVNFYAIHKAKAQEKVKELFHHQFPNAKTSVSSATEIFTRYLAFRMMREVK